MMKRYLILVALFAPAAIGETTPPADTVAPNPHLTVDGVPPVPKSLSESVNRYTEFRAALMLDWHPADRQMLIATRFADTPQLHRVKMPGGARTQLTFFPEPVSEASYSPKAGGEFFVFGKDVGGNEFSQNFRFDVTTGAATLLTDGKSRNSAGVWSKTSGRLAYTSTRRNGKDTDVYVVDPRDPKTDKLVTKVESGGWSATDWSPGDDSKLLLHEYVSINESYLWLLDVASGQRTPITPRKTGGGADPISYDGGQFSADGKSIFTTTDKDSQFMRLARVDVANGEHAFLSPNVTWDVENFELSPDGKSIAYTINEYGASVLHVVDAASGKEMPAPKLPLGVIPALHWHQNSRDLGFTLTSARSPADAYSLDISAGKIERWTESETGGLNAATFVEPEIVRWKSFDDHAISGLLYLPPSDKFPGKRPVIIDIHGGPEGQSRPVFLARKNYFLNELGVALIFPNVRGSTGFGKDFAKLDNGLKREDAVKDVGALLDWIAKQDGLDASRVMVTGGSYGGFMTLAAATAYNDRVRCSLDVVGISNFISFLERTEAYRRDLRRAEYGDERDPAMRAFMEKIAPLNNAGKITKPLFIVQGKNDPRVPVGEAEQMVAKVKQSGTPVWYLVADNEGHGFTKKPNADYQFFATVMFVKKFLLQ
jgi:dipeptidyl aminopeptidase/acylaminoacyl peptidase